MSWGKDKGKGQRYGEEGYGRQSHVATMPLHIYRLFTTWQTLGC
jgi:hypothetical protein